MIFVCELLKMCLHFLMCHLFSPHVDDADKPEEEEKGSFFNQYSHHKFNIDFELICLIHI